MLNIIAPYNKILGMIINTLKKITSIIYIAETHFGILGFSKLEIMHNL